MTGLEHTQKNMDQKVIVQINTELCTACGACCDVCPFKNLVLFEGKAICKGETCISCGHCAAACPTEAICSPVIDYSEDYATFTADNRWLPYGQYDTAGLVRLMASRRSCRNFLEKKVDIALLEDLVKIGITAPSGTNCQLWTFTIIPTRKAVVSFAGHIAAFFKKLNVMAERRFLRKTLKMFGQDKLDTYYRQYYPIVKQAIEELESSGKDRLFHGAVAAIVVGSESGASCPAEDALLATQNVLLGAHSMGLGSCLIGFAVSAMKEAPAIMQAIGIPEDETVHSVIALGYPSESYKTTAVRRKAKRHYFEG